MPDIEGVTVRRHHILLMKSLSRPFRVCCPDCRQLLFKVIERSEGCTKHECRRCKDGNGNRKRWMFIFHAFADDYVQAIKVETLTIDLTPVVDKVAQTMV